MDSFTPLGVKVKYLFNIFPNFEAVRKYKYIQKL